MSGPRTGEQEYILQLEAQRDAMVDLLKRTLVYLPPGSPIEATVVDAIKKARGGR